MLKEYHGEHLPTNACLLFADYSSRKEFFPYSKIECARFKGTSTDTFIDQKTIDDHIGIQAELAYDFVLRHINKGATVNGVYTKSRWEYPVAAIREALRNAVVHRDYSLTGKDIKVAIYDDMVEITSPGKLMPSIDFNELEARQSDIRNKVIAPIFKKIGVIDQWGNGLKLIAAELKAYPDIEFKWFEKGLSFQVQFIKKSFTRQPELQPELRPELQPELQQDALYGTVLRLLGFKPMNTKEIATRLSQKEISGQLRKVIRKLHSDRLIAYQILDKPTHPSQKHQITEQGRVLLQLLEKQRK
ncbi:ATP-binding protein [Paraflavitalea speifideaquila]|uniref:ATP-binding protein n=1 Tax=Paraflavitalea speifideaquila TaxID=3076558 RepID=UPI0028EFB80F|nr:ATP-binding protein [Paraflavitalea speifideiaquila]